MLINLFGLLVLLTFIFGGIELFFKDDNEAGLGLIAMALLAGFVLAIIAAFTKGAC